MNNYSYFLFMLLIMLFELPLKAQERQNLRQPKIKTQNRIYNISHKTNVLNEDPEIVSFDINTFHEKNNYRIDAWAVVHDPQGQNDIAQVKAIDAQGNEFILNLHDSDFYYGNQSYGLTPPPLDVTRIVAIDIAANSDTVSENLTNVVEELPTILYPTIGELVPETEPLFDWNDVSDDQSTIDYTISVYRSDLVTAIWGPINIFESQVQFNVDGSANELLEDGSSYYLEVIANDTLGNSSYDIIKFTIGRYIKIENEYLQIEFHPTRPYVKKYTSKINNEEIFGDLVDEMFYAKIFHQGIFYDVTPLVVSKTQENNKICYHMRADIELNLAATFDLCYVLDGYTVKVIFNNVTESVGYKLVLVRSPDLLTVRANQSGAKLVFPEYEGRLIDVNSANTGYADINLDNSGWNRPLLASMIYHNGFGGIVDYDHLDLVLWSRISQMSYNNEKIATIGMTFNYRYAPTDFSKAAFINVFDSVTTSLSTDLTFLADFDNDGDVDWMDGAKYLRSQVKIAPDPRYLRSFVGKIGVNGVNSIYDHLNTIKKLYQLTDHNKIHLYLLDYGPLFELFGVEADLKPEWPLEDLIQVFEESAESYNTILSFHDNYTDYYPGTPSYDPSLRVIREDGTPWPGWPLDNYPDAFWTDPYDYALNFGINRVRSTLARYPIKETYHLDVLSLVFPKDYSLESPSSRERNRRGVQMIVDEFEIAGIDITSEGLTGQYVESGMGFFLDTPRFFNSYLPFQNEQIIPFLEFIYHGKTLYGLFEDIYWDVLPPSQVNIYKYLEPLLLGANSWVHITWQDPNDLEVDKFYIVDLPWMMLNQKFMEDYQESGSYRKIIYNEDTFVEIDYVSNSYEVQVDGRIIGKNYTTIYPKSDSTFLIYSRDEKEVSVQLPDDWNNGMRLMELSETGTAGDVPFTILARNLVFSTKANTPYKLIKSSPTNVNEDENLNNSVIKTSELFQNYPNPFNSTTTIKYQIPQIPKDGKVSVMIYDIYGQLINILVNEKQKSGVYSVKWDASKVSSGVYFYKIKVGEFNDVKKAIFLK